MGRMCLVLGMLMRKICPFDRDQWQNGFWCQFGFRIQKSPDLGKHLRASLTEFTWMHFGIRIHMDALWYQNSHGCIKPCRLVPFPTLKQSPDLYVMLSRKTSKHL